MHKKWKKHDLSLIMGILNITPDSFFDGGKYMKVQHAVARAIEMANNGASIIDIGGISTRPGFSEVSIEEERRRVIPIIKAVRQALPNIWISLDSWRSEVAEEGILAGVNFLNDQWGAKYDPKMAQLAAKYDLPICLMHNRQNAHYTDFLSDVKNDLLESVQICQKAGLAKRNIILDPGIGFVKTPEQDLEVIRRIDEVVDLGFEVLLAASRKSTIGKVLDLPVDQRMEGTGATTVYAISKGCSIVRVHDVKAMYRMARMTDGIMGKIPL
ncbi:dihydropteroate synthase [Listeria booriae]|uniref:dihydropteroate synthase n=1 Tax=Listeria booriae TaxID=1552123 RepID=UPI00162A6DD0|nr:dihydropteroate synthase [Listeria booriae]MBC1559038.1 dihydropteroate synthase [Listeria booriae]